MSALGVNVAKIIQASLGSTSQTLDRRTARLHSGRSTFPYPQVSRPTPVSRAPRVQRVRRAPAVVAPPKVAKPAGRHVQVIIKLLIPH